MARRIRTVVAWLTRIMTQPLEELNRFQKSIRFLYDLGRYGGRQLQYDRAPQMAGALAFRTLFALLPVMVVGTLVFRTMRGFEDFKEYLATIFESLGLDKFTVSGAADVEAAVAGGQSLSEWLLELLGSVENINVAAIGWVGVAVMIYAALSLMVTIEKSFNIVYRAPEGRGWMSRLVVYWAFLSLGPLAIGVAMYGGGLLESLFSEQTGWLRLFKAAPVIWNYLAVWLVTFAMYKLIPHTKVTFRPALVGALVAAILLELGKRGMGAYFANAISFGQLYGSLGLIPVFMFWVYVMWLVILFGLEVSATLQMLGGRRLEEMEAAKERTGLVDPTAVLLVMQVVARNFASAQSTTAREIADETAMAESTVARMLDELTIAGILHRLDREDGAVGLARPPDQVSADELIEVGYRMVDEATGQRSVIIERLRDAQKKLAGQITLTKLASFAPGQQPSG